MACIANLSPSHRPPQPSLNNGPVQRRVHKEGDDLMSATRYAVMMLRHARADIPPKPRSIRRGLGGWMSA
jgi:hypothetical protein